jgi:hypothetical protein
LPGCRGGTVTLDGLLEFGRPLLMVFSDAHCRPCAEAVGLVARAQHDWSNHTTVALISKGSTPDSEAAWAEHGLEHVAVADSHDVSLSYGATGTPAALTVSVDGRIDSPLELGLPRVARLLAAPVGSEWTNGYPDDRGVLGLALSQGGGAV